MSESLMSTESGTVRTGSWSRASAAIVLIAVVLIAVALIATAATTWMVFGIPEAAAQTDSHHLMIYAPGQRPLLMTVVDGTLDDGDRLALACFDLDAPRGDGYDYVATGLRFENGTYLSVGLSTGTCTALGSSIGTWQGYVPGADGYDNLWVSPSYRSHGPDVHLLHARDRQPVPAHPHLGTGRSTSTCHAPARRARSNMFMA